MRERHSGQATPRASDFVQDGLIRVYVRWPRLGDGNGATQWVSELID